jgi:putative DNA methylase
MKKKLIEVSLPLDAINDASAYDKMPGIGAHPKGIHYYPARLPLPAARSILFASLVDDPSSNPDQFPTVELQEAERERLFNIIRSLCQPKIHLLTKDVEIAINEIKKHCDNVLPTTHDPFSGGGSIPLEGMRLGMDVIAADLSPVSVLLNKATVELLPKFAKHPPINPASQNAAKGMHWENAAGLVEDLRYYGNIIQKRAEKLLSPYYPKVKIPGGREATVLTYIWARTVKCPNPVCGCEMPLVKSFALRSKKEPKYYFEAIVEKSPGIGNKVTGYKITGSNPGPGSIKRNKAICVACDEPVKLDYIKAEGIAGRMGNRMVAIVADLGRGKTYVAPSKEQEDIALTISYGWSPDFIMSDHPQYMAPPRYGLTHFNDLFTKRQLFALTTLSTLIHELYQELENKIAPDYLKTLILYLFFSVDRLADFNCAVSTWKHSGEQQMHLFTANRIAMAMDYTEANVICGKAICWSNAVDLTIGGVEVTLNKFCHQGVAIQKNAEVSDPSLKKLLVSTDPPYYNNIPYADLMDFFYVWMKKNLEPYFPEITKTLLTPKAEELVANEFRFDGDKEKAKEHFESGFKRAFTVLKDAMDERFPMTIYYAFKQEEEEESDENGEDGSSNQIGLTTGWETILEAVVQSGFQITATWPLRASQQWRLRAMGSNALASYIVMVCRKRNVQATSITRREYIQELKKELPEALRVLQHSNLAPVDLAQAALGPGMGIYSKYASILEQDGSTMKVRAALSLINKTLDELLTEQEGDFDQETRWALAWFEQYGTDKQPYGQAESLCRAKGTAVNALIENGIITAVGGIVKLLGREELPIDWEPESGNRTAIWKVTQHLIKRLQEDGEIGAAKLYRKVGGKADVSRELAYRLFTISEKKGWTVDAIAYNSLVLSWNQIVAESYNLDDSKKSVQQKLEF